ncbi:hypothetical protein JCM10908_007065 [Rhodotorula pacifica]|uniref:uncharacterized protein n=1 Tax=Rhodotorula pacifica TaxID=1495444 RepID=UPI0031771C86
MVSSIFNLRKRAITLADSPSPSSPSPSSSHPSSPAASLSFSHSTRRSRAFSRLSRFGSLSSRRKDSSSLVASPASYTVTLVDDDGASSPLSPTLTERSLGSFVGAGGGPLKKKHQSSHRRHSRSFSSVLTSIFPPSTSASSPPSPLSSRSPSLAPTSPLSPVSSVRPRFTSERKKINKHDGLKRRISYPLLRESSDQPATRSEGWGARDETQKAPTPTPVLTLSRAGTPTPLSTSRASSRSHACLLNGGDDFGSQAFPSAADHCAGISSSAASSLTPVSLRPRSAASSLSRSARPYHGGVAHLASRFSLSTEEESACSTSTSIHSSGGWVEFPTASNNAVASVDRFATVEEEEPIDPAFSAIGLDVKPPVSSTLSSSQAQELDVFTSTPPPSPEMYRKHPYAGAFVHEGTGLAPFDENTTSTTYSWTSKETTLVHGTPEATRTLPEATQKSQQQQCRLLMTPPPTPRILPFRPNPVRPDLAITPPVHLWARDSLNLGRNYQWERKHESTRGSLLSITLAELSDEMANFRRTRYSESTDEDDDRSQMSLSPPSFVSVSAVPFPSTLAGGPPSFLDMDGPDDSSPDSPPSEALHDSPTPLPKVTPAPQRLLRRISQRLKPTRPSPGPLMSDKPACTLKRAATTSPSATPVRRRPSQVVHASKENSAYTDLPAPRSELPRRHSRFSLRSFATGGGTYFS